MGAASLLLLACSVAHYYLITCAFLTPFFVGYVFFHPQFRLRKKLIVKRFILGTLPAILFLGFNFKFTLPSDARMAGSESYPKTGETANGEPHPFLWIFAAHPIDYLAGDISLQPTIEDLNPLRARLGEYIHSIPEMGNWHERTNGIRWSILILAAIGVGSLARGRWSESKKLILFFLIFSGFAFWLSLDPDSPSKGVGPSLWLHRLVSQVRVPSRAGIFVHFSLLMIAGFFLQSLIPVRSNPANLLSGNVQKPPGRELSTDHRCLQ